MAGPWEDFQDETNGPWNDFQDEEAYLKEDTELAGNNLLPGPARMTSAVVDIVGEGIEYLQDSAVGEVADSFIKGGQRPVIGALQHTPETTAKIQSAMGGGDNEETAQDKLASMAKENERIIDERGFWKGTLPAFTGEMSNWYLAARATLAGGKAVTGPVSIPSSVTMLMNKAGQTISKVPGGQTASKFIVEGSKGAAGGAIGEELVPLTGETPEERKQQQEAKDIEGSAEIGGAVGTAIQGVSPLWRFGKNLLATTGLFGRGIAKETAKQSLQKEFGDFVENVANPARVRLGKEPFDADTAVQNIDELLADIDTYKKNTGAELNFTVADMADSPELVAFLAKHKGKDAVEFFSTMAREGNKEKIAAIIDSSLEKAKSAEEVISGVEGSLSGKTTAELTDLQKGLKAEEGVVLAPNTTGLPEEISREASKSAKLASAQEQAAISDLYGQVSSGMKGVKLNKNFVKKDIKDFLDSFSGEERKRINAAIPKSLKDVLKDKDSTITYDDLQVFIQDVQQQIDSSVNATGKATDIYAPKVRDFLEDKLSAEAIKNSGKQELLAVKEQADTAYKAFRDKARAFTTDETGNVVSTSAAPTVKAVQSTSPNKEFFDEKWLDNAVSTRSSVEETLKAYPDSKPYIEDYIVAKVADIADANTGNISRQKLVDFMMKPEVRDALKSPELAGVKQKLDDLMSTAKTSGKANIATAFSERLDDPAFLDSLWGASKSKLRKQVLNTAKEAGVEANVRNAMRKSLGRRMLTDAGGDVDIASKNLVNKLSNTKSNEYAVYKEIFGDEGYDNILEGLKLLNSVDKNAEFKAIEEAASAARPISEFVGIKLGLLAPAEATRLGTIIQKSLGPRAYRDAFLELQTNPEAMKSFLEASKNPTVDNVENFINTLQVLNVAATDNEVQTPYDFESGKIPPPKFKGTVEGSKGGVSPTTIPNSNIPKPKYPSGGGVKGPASDSGKTGPQSSLNPNQVMGNSGGDTLRQPNLSLGLVEDTTRGFIDTPPESPMKKDITTSTQKKIARYANDAARKTGLPPKFLKTMLAIESGLGKADPINPSQIQQDAWIDMVAKYGDKHGITTGMRNDPAASVLMGAYYLSDQAEQVSKKLGRKAEPFEVYMSYQMGPGNFDKYIKLMKERKGTPVAKVVSGTEDNALFYYEGGKASGRPLNYKEVAKKFKTHLANKKKEFAHFME